MPQFALSGPKSAQHSLWYVGIGPYTFTRIPRVASTSLTSVGAPINTPTSPLVGLVRNPKARFASAAGMMFLRGPDILRGDHNRLIELMQDIPPEQIDLHLRPQSWFFDPYPDCLIALESIEVGFKRLGLPPLANMSGPGDWRPYWCDFLSEFYRPDLTLWEEVTRKGGFLKRRIERYL